MREKYFLAADYNSYKLEKTVKLWERHSTYEGAKEWLSRNGGGWLWEVFQKESSNDNYKLGQSYLIPDEDENNPPMCKVCPPLC